MSRREKLSTFGPSPGINGIIELLNWEDCTRPYTGPRRHEDIYVVGRGTDFERLFDTHSWRQVQEYSNTQEPRLKYFRASATQLCVGAVEDLFGEHANV